MNSLTGVEKATSIVIFGGSGDLTQRKLVPALFSLHRKGRLPARTNIVGFSRTAFSHDQYRDHLRQGMQTHSPQTFDADAWASFAQHVYYSPGDSESSAGLAQLNELLEKLEAGLPRAESRGPADRLYYCATAPSLFGPVARALGRTGMADEAGVPGSGLSTLGSPPSGFRRIVLEKPFGSDLASAQELNRELHSVFREDQIYRMDHYLGKETAQNILFFRFANSMFEPVWNRNYVDNIQVTVFESEGVGHRGGYYDQAGVLRDMFQNHLLQLLCLVAMEPPASFDAEAVRDEKAKVLRAIAPVSLADTVRGQYRSYRESPKVAPDSQAATYGAVKLYIDNWRWQGVPCYLRSGKSLSAKSSQVDIVFRCPPHIIFRLPPFGPNLLSIRIQPDEGIHLQFQAKVPDSAETTREVEMAFHYSSYFHSGQLPDAYERLLLDALRGDASLFPREDAIDLAWQLIDPIVAGWASPDAPPLATYEPGSPGPIEADGLMSRDGACCPEGCGGYRTHAGTA
ncbi:MAG: glucose-6-phosphate dehydrogenase [Armatimonadota bacterium]